jgi:hypothetical protein
MWEVFKSGPISYKELIIEDVVGARNYYLSNLSPTLLLMGQITNGLELLIQGFYVITPDGQN